MSYNGHRDQGLRVVGEFHRVFGHPTHAEPFIEDGALNELRVELIREELEELEDALAARDPVATLDALVDLQYVLDGAYHALGFAKVKEAALNRVHESNMSKALPDGTVLRREDGKILKGPDYKPPSLEDLV